MSGLDMVKKLKVNSIARMVDALKKAEAGGYAVRLDVSGKDEDLGRLAGAINGLFDMMRGCVAEQERLEDALDRGEQRYKNILDSIEVAYYEVDLKGNFTFFNPSAVKSLGYADDELMGMNFRRYMDKDNAEKVYKAFHNVYLRRENINRIDWEIINKSGGKISVESSVSLMKDGRGAPVGFRGVVYDITERKKTEDFILEAVEKYRSLLENIDTAYFEIDLKGNFTYFNDVLCKILGYEREELQGMNYRVYSKPENIKMIKDMYGEIYRTGKSKTMVFYELLRKDGSRIVVEQSMSLMRGPTGEAIGFQGVGRDITERINAEEELKKNELKYRRILESMEDGYYELDLKGSFTFFNDAAYRNLGYEPNELKHVNYRAYTSPETARRLNQVFRRLYETGEFENLLEYEVIRKDGSVRHHEMSTGLLRDAAGRPEGFHVLARDITARREAENALRRSEEKYRTILETMQEGLFENDLRGNYTYVNDFACRLLGYTRDELIGKNFKSVFPPHLADFVFKAYRRVYETSKPELLLDHEVMHKNGTIMIHQANIELIRDLSGKAAGFRTLAWDVTERRKMEKEKAVLEDQLLQAQKMESIGQLAGGVAHDFNNMLGVILGYVELIKLQLPRSDPLFHNVMEIEKAAIRSRDITGQLLAFSRKQITSPITFDMNDLVMSMQKTLFRLIGEDIDLQYYPGKDIWKIKFDPSQMQQILINLAANARDAMPDGGKLIIETRNMHLSEEYCSVHHGFSPGHYVMLGVSDDGIGMDKETLQHVFEPFFTTKETGKGTGLGLATVYGIVKQHNGFINVYSESGKGTTFKIYIPRSMEEGVTYQEAEEAFVAPGSGTVLLVEDDDMVRKMTSDMLEAIGYSVVSTGSPLEAQKMYENRDIRIDLLLTDVVMPGMSGKELRDRIAATRPGIKVLFMSGYTSNVIVHRGVLEDGVHFVQKPFSMGDLARKVREALSGKKDGS
jgi:two-component system cell cycle sensor histidine kinase/response regulator CckA